MSTIASRLLAFARAIGRWLLERLARRGANMLIGYMAGKIDDFARRKDAAAKRGNERRVRWLTGRIRRWTSARNWLIKHEAEASIRVAKEAMELAKRAGIPVVAPGESERSALAA